MTNATSDAQRRTLLQSAAGLATMGALGLSSSALASAVKPAATGKAGDFDFLSGHWKIKNRKFNAGAWDLFDGEATVYGILGGIASIEELRIPARNFSGMGLRLLDLQAKLWADFWVNSKSGVLTPPPTWGSFVDGVGTWDDLSHDSAPAEIVRGVWDRISPNACRWYQAVSKDGGKSWQEQWSMDWSRA